MITEQVDARSLTSAIGMWKCAYCFTLSVKMERSKDVGFSWSSRNTDRVV